MTRRTGARWDIAVIVMVAAALLASCALLPRPQRSASSSSAPPPSASSVSPTASAPSTPATSPSATPTNPRQRRPVQPIPDVKPDGFADPPPGSGLDRYRRQELGWKGCGKKGLECTTVLAPLDYTKPDGQALTLALARKKSSQEPRLGSLFINPGGPGGSGVDYVGGFAAANLEQFDIVGWDPRGVGKSTPVTCQNGAELEKYLNTDTSPDDATETKDLIASERAFGRSCLERSGALLAHVSTQDTVRDLDLLRGLVGDQKLNYFGSSYGTQIGATYAQLFGPTVGRMVLDGAVDISDDDSVSQAEGFDRALSTFADWCAARECKLGATKKAVINAVTGLWKRLDSKPMPAGKRELTQAQAITGVTFVLYQPEEAFPYLAEALALAIDDNDGRYLLFFADQYNERNNKGEYGQGAFSFPAIRCLDSQESSVAQAEKDWAKVRKDAPIFGPFSGLDLTCPTWPIAPAPEVPKITGPAQPPIIVIGTTGDPATPYEQAVAMAKQLRSGVLVTWEGEGHLAYGKSRCVQRIVADFLNHDQVPQDGARC